MKRTRLVTAAFAAAGIAGAAAAQDLHASDPQSFVDFFFSEGYPAKLSEDTYGDPMIDFRVDDYPYTLFFYECTDGADCGSVRVYIGYETDGDVGLDMVNTLNAENRFMTAAIDSEDDVILTMDVITGENGLAAGDFRMLLEVYFELGREFEERVGWVSD